MTEQKPRGPRRATTRLSTAIRLADEAGPERCKSLLELVRAPDRCERTENALADLEASYKSERDSLKREQAFAAECSGADEGTLGSIELYVAGLAARSTQ